MISAFGTPSLLHNERLDGISDYFGLARCFFRDGAIQSGWSRHTIQVERCTVRCALEPTYRSLPLWMVRSDVRCVWANSFEKRRRPMRSVHTSRYLRQYNELCEVWLFCDHGNSSCETWDETHATNPHVILPSFLEHLVHSPLYIIRKRKHINFAFSTKRR